MGNDGVLTTNDYMRQRNIEKGQEEKPAPIPKNVKIEKRYLFPPAPMGKSRTAITFEDKPMKIEMVDGIYSPPKNWSRARLEKFHKVIQIYGFVDKSRVAGQGNQKKIERKKYIFTIGHPDNTPDEKVKGTIAVTVNFKEYTFPLKEGVIETEDETIYKALLKKGWYEVSIKEMEEKK